VKVWEAFINTAVTLPAWLNQFMTSIIGSFYKPEVDVLLTAESRPNSEAARFQCYWFSNLDDVDLLFSQQISLILLFNVFLGVSARYIYQIFVINSNLIKLWFRRIFMSFQWLLSFEAQSVWLHKLVCFSEHFLTFFVFYLTFLLKMR